MIGKKRRYWLAGNREPAQDIFFVEALDSTLWTEGDAENWDACWYTGMPAPQVFDQLNAAKTVNHIPGNNGLTVKSYLFQTLAAASDRVAGQPDAGRMAFFPRVYAMPEDYLDLQDAAARDPDKRWILKPKNSSRGRGIELIRDVAAAPMNNRWLVQEYVDRPHLMNARKYVLRLYVLVTSVEPLRVYFYREGFAKLASEPYDPHDADNPFSNLTNPDINAANEDVETPVEFVSLSAYRDWLSANAHDPQALFAKIRDLLALTIISVRDKMRTRTRAIGADTSGCYELLGIDCLIDADLKPWILECNLSPSLDVCASPDHGADEERRIKRQLIADMAAIVGLNEPRTNFESLSDEERIRRESERELACAGDFERIFPAADVENFLPFFPVPRYADIVLAGQITGRPAPRLHLAPRRTTEIISEDELALYSEKTGTLYSPNPSASWIWLKAVSGADPEEIAKELTASHETAHGPAAPAEQWRVRKNVWDVLADWAGLGLIRHAGAEADCENGVDSKDPNCNESDQVRVCERAVAFNYGCPVAAERMRKAFHSTAGDGGSDQIITIQRARVGYAVAVDTRVIGSDISLAAVAPVVRRVLFELAPVSQSQIAMQTALAPMGNGEAALIIGPPESGWDGMTACLTNKIGASVLGGARLDLNADESIATIGLPLRIEEDDVEEIEAALGHALTLQVHQWPGEGRQGRLLKYACSPGSTRYAIRTVVTLARGGNRDGETELRPSSVHDALRALIPLCSGPQGRLTCAAASGLGDWLAGRALRTLEFSSLATGAEALAGALIRENA
ncbi:MAG: amylase [Parvularculaceae bacterium]